MKVKVYQYEEDGVGCTDLVIEEQGKVYPFLTSIFDLDDLVFDFDMYSSVSLEDGPPENAVLVKEYDTEE